ncbi:hypothetical protein PIB30_074214 [Stylosanthes scabra]|uniref:Uncharacterized protein n=1 Tax=Stylosanthes scabra TaxID=79078 RepID=A0ABU6VQQ2_9FABA|nr:hypothetical protein [Stylosanthes scabra]
MFTNILPLRHSQPVGVKTHEDEDSKEEEWTEEEMLWRSMVEEASVMHKGLDNNEVLDHETVKRFVSPLWSLKVINMRSISALSNITKSICAGRLTILFCFLTMDTSFSLMLVTLIGFANEELRPSLRAEEYYKRSALEESPEAEAFSIYGDFLWMVTKDLWAAELKYLIELEAEPGNTYYLSKYASFLRNTGGQDNTSFLLEEIDNF